MIFFIIINLLAQGALLKRVSHHQGVSYKVISYSLSPSFCFFEKSPLGSHQHIPLQFPKLRMGIIIIIRKGEHSLPLISSHCYSTNYPDDMSKFAMSARLALSFRL